MGAWSAPAPGQTLLFTPGASLLHRANPLTSLVIMLWMISLAAVLPTIGTSIVILAGIAAAFAVGVGPTVMRRLLVTMIPLGIALIAVHGFIIRSPDDIVLGPIAFSPSGGAYALQIFTRIAAMLTASLLFVTTTHPGDMLKALDVRGVSPALSYLIASPLLLLEPLSTRALDVRDAQRARGMDLHGSWRARIAALPALLVPLVTLALSDLDHRVLVLNGRAFRARKRRTVLDAPPDDRTQVWLRRVIIVAAVLQLGIPLVWH
jgi:energy-coupling factor transport system permease protein